MNIQGWFPLGFTSLISLLYKGLSRVFSSPTIQKHKFFHARSAFFMVQLSHLHMTTGKTTALTIQTFVSKVMSLVFNTPSRFVLTLLPRSKCLLILWLQSLSTVILEPKKIKSDTVATLSPSIFHEVSKKLQKNIYFCFIDYAKAFDCVDHSKLWKILKEVWIPDHLTCLLRNLYADQEATVRTGHRTTDWFQTGKGIY